MDLTSIAVKTEIAAWRCFGLSDRYDRDGPQSLGDVSLDAVEDAVFEIRQRAEFVGWTDYEREQQYHALADHLLDAKQEWPVGVGAVLYGLDGDEESRDLWHVTDRFASVDGSTKLVTLWDGTHTSRRYVRAEDLLADYTPAGWSWPTGKKPLYHLTRECGADDRADLMTDGGGACSSCGGQIIDAYELPGGDVVHADDVAFSDGPMGVSAIEVCRQCGAQVEVDGDA
jgi:hypothetical protein